METIAAELQARHDPTRWAHMEERERRVERRERELEELERSAEEREKGLEGMQESLEEQRRCSEKLRSVLEEMCGGMRLRLSEFEEKATRVGVRFRGESGNGGGGGMWGGLRGEEVVKAIRVVSGSEEVAKLCRGVDCVYEIKDVIRTLLDRKKVIEAVSFICTFKFTDEFPPIPLLNEYVEDAGNWWSETFSQASSLHKKENAVVDRLTSLRAVAQCVKDYSLQSEFSLANIDNEISELEKLKENLHSVASLDTMLKTVVSGKLNEKREVVLCLPSYDRKHQSKQRGPGLSTRVSMHRRCRKKSNCLAIAAASPMTQTED